MCKAIKIESESGKLKLQTCELPERVIGMFARAAQVIEWSGTRTILHGINLSSDGIAATNGKELVNYDLLLNFEDNLTILVPLNMIQSKENIAGKSLNDRMRKNSDLRSEQISGAVQNIQFYPTLP